jgi:hypothetical protein
MEGSEMNKLPKHYTIARLILNNIPRMIGE